MKIKGSKESWISAKLYNKYQTKNIQQKFDDLGYEIDNHIENQGVVIRKKKRFDWHLRGNEIKRNKLILNNYHKNIRKDFHYIW